MSGARVVLHRSVIAAYDYGHFSLLTAEPDPDLQVHLLERALEGDGIAQSDAVLVVTSPHQNNLAMPLVVEVWDASPEDDLAEWQEAYEAHLQIAASGLIFDSPTLDPVVFDVPPGHYLVAIAARGFSARGWPGSATPSDQWRLRLWPADAPMAAHRVRKWGPESTDEESDRPNAEIVRAGRAAARRIADDLIMSDIDRYRDHRLSSIDHAADPGVFRQRVFEDVARARRGRQLSGELGRVRASRSFAAPAARLKIECAPDVVDTWVCPPWDDDDENPINEHGRISFTPVADASVDELAYLWNWYLPAFDGVSLLPVDSTLRLFFDGSGNADDRTVIVVDHSGLPAEWRDDMMTYWMWRLEAADIVYLLGRE